MNFSEAMERLQEGSKVSRQSAKNQFFFKMVDDEVKYFGRGISNYQYDQSIFLSNGWHIVGLEIEGLPVEMQFFDLIPHLKSGAKAYLKDWKDAYIYADSSTKSLLINTVNEHPVYPDLESLMAEDWIEIE